MKQILLNITFFLLINSIHATTISSIPDEISLNEHWISLTKSYDIETKTQKLGTLYRRFFSFPITYDFYNPMDVKTATAKASFFSFRVHLDVFDQTYNFLGGVEEKIFTWFPTFNIFGSNASTKLARAEMNFWGTKFHIYDPATNEEMFIMSRPFFRLKNDWTIHITNRNLLERKNIDSRLLMIVLAAQGEIDDWKNRNRKTDVKLVTTNTSLQQSQTKYKNISQQITSLNLQTELDKLDTPNEETLEILLDELEENFNAPNKLIHDENQSDEEKINMFASYYLNLIDSINITPIKKKAILTLLNLRLQEMMMGN